MHICACTYAHGNVRYGSEDVDGAVVIWRMDQPNHQPCVLINTAFIKTGFKIAKDGSEDHLIDIQGWSDPVNKYTYGSSGNE